jgi:hypothetical protein
MFKYFYWSSQGQRKNLTFNLYFMESKFYIIIHDWVSSIVPPQQRIPAASQAVKLLFIKQTSLKISTPLQKNQIILNWYTWQNFNVNGKSNTMRDVGQVLLSFDNFTAVTLNQSSKDICSRELLWLFILYLHHIFYTLFCTVIRQRGSISKHKHFLVQIILTVLLYYKIQYNEGRQ